jgi:hypothetical protein
MTRVSHAPIFMDGVRIGTVTCGPAELVDPNPIGEGFAFGPAPHPNVRAQRFASREMPSRSFSPGSHAGTHNEPHRRLGGLHTDETHDRHLSPVNREHARKGDLDAFHHPDFGGEGSIRRTPEEIAKQPDYGSAPKENLKGSEYLRNQRAWIARELDADPSLRRYLGGVLAHEQGPGRERQMVMESLANRLNYLRANGQPNLTLREYLSRTGTNQFYGPIRRGQITEALQNQAHAQGVNSDIDAVLAGTNLVRGFSDQGSAGDPNYHRGEYMDTPGRESYNDFGGARAWRQEQQRHVEQGGSSEPQQTDSPAATNAPSGSPSAFIVHHTGGRGDPASVVADWRAHRPGVGTQFIMDREGVIHDVAREYGYGGRGHFLHSVVPGVSNQTAVGMEIVAKDDADITAKQRENAIKFIQSQYPSTPVYGHSEVSPSDRTNEGVNIARTIREQRERKQASDK